MEQVWQFQPLEALQRSAHTREEWAPPRKDTSPADDLIEGLGGVLKAIMARCKAQEKAITENPGQVVEVKARRVKKAKVDKPKSKKKVRK